MTAGLPNAAQVNPKRSLDRSAWLKATICTETMQRCRECYGGGLRAIVLTGSLARDEATLIEEDEGSALLGDSEFLVIFDERTPLPRTREVERLSSKIEAALLQSGVACHVGLSAAHPAYLRKLPPHIFTYELRACGQVIWGDQAILAMIPGFSSSEIPLEDAYRLLCNRIVEQLEVVEEMTPGSQALPRSVHYRTVKLYLDMATSLLVFMGAYEPSYRARAERLRSLADRSLHENQLPFPLRAFAAQVTTCTRWKLSSADRHTGAGWDFWEQAVATAHKLGRWELARLTGMEDEASDRLPWERWMRHQPLRHRLRAWLYVIRSQGWHRSWRDWPRWVWQGWRASPRYWVYAAACDLFFELPASMKMAHKGSPVVVDLNILHTWLPLRVVRAEGGVPDWRQHAADIVHNYRELLKETRT